jgi:beta-galactosidase/beta-glucuronidase
MINLILLAAALWSAPTQSAPPDSWRPTDGPLRTRWSKDVRPENPWNIYPRPQFERAEWQSLNGLWEYAIVPAPAAEGAHPAFPPKADGTILVPYPLESQLSGVGRALQPDQRLLYKRTFQSAPADPGARVLLHFGAVDWACSVRVNGKDAGVHSGGFDPFSFDITALVQTGDNQLQVAVADPTDYSTQPRGKQIGKPEGIWYSPVSGIWQTVWLERVPAVALTKLEAQTDRTNGAVKFTVAAAGANLRGTTLSLEIQDHTGTKIQSVQSNMSSGTAEPNVLIPKPAPWSPETPVLYTVVATLKDRTGSVVDTVKSYFAFRDVKLVQSAEGKPTIELNGKPYFMIGLLDQGWWPDGLYTAPTPEAMAYDLQITRSCGFNTIRKHVKVEPAVWYAACDRMGILVWQDMPSGDGSIGPNDPDMTRDTASAQIYQRELAAMITWLRVFPSIVLWVPFNEGWGQFDSKRITTLVKTLDPTRLVTTASGWTDRASGDTLDIHDYAARLEGHVPDTTHGRAWVIGECGGFGLPEPGHMWKDKGWGYTTYKDREALTVAYEALAADLLQLRADGLCAAIYTQTTDVESEVNGVMTYDRDVIKFNSARMQAANQALVGDGPKRHTFKAILMNAREAMRSGKNAPEWHMSFTKPADTWVQPFFDDKSWVHVRAGFGRKGTPGTDSIIATIWETPDIWLRRSFALSRKEPTPTHLTIHHDEDAEVWIDGHKVITLTGYTTGYIRVELPEETRKKLGFGNHVIAVHCKQTSGGQYIDVGLCAIVPE